MNFLETLLLVVHLLVAVAICGFVLLQHGKGADMVKSLLRLSYFYFEESCGQCTPCREGTGWLWRMVHRIEHGEGRAEDLTLLDSVAENIMGRTICALGDAAAMPVRGMLKHFRDEFAYHVEHKHCMVGPGAQRAATAELATA